MNIEEKAKRYADRYPNDRFYDVRNLTAVSERSYFAGYTQAVTDLSAENEKLREALRELIEHIDKCPLDLSSDEKVEEATFLDAIKNEAKQLITEP